MPNQHTSTLQNHQITIKLHHFFPPGFHIFWTGVYRAEAPGNNQAKCLQNIFKPSNLGPAQFGVALWKETLGIPAYNEQHHQQDKVLTPFSTSQAKPGMLCSVLAPNMLKRHGWAGEGPGKGHKDDQRIGKLAMRGKAEGTGMLNLNKKMLKGISVFK